MLRSCIPVSDTWAVSDPPLCLHYVLSSLFRYNHLLYYCAVEISGLGATYPKQLVVDPFTSACHALNAIRLSSCSQSPILDTQLPATIVTDRPVLLTTFATRLHVGRKTNAQCCYALGVGPIIVLCSFKML